MEISLDDPVAIAWLGLIGRDNLRALHARAHRNALAQPRPVDYDFQQFWFDMEIILDEVLNRFEARYLKIQTHLDTLRQKKHPTKNDAKFLKNNIPNNIVAFSYFFRDLNNPAWLRLLLAEGFFRYPPEPIENVGEGTISYPLWPQSRYLIKMAPLAPDEVSEIILRIETMNAHIHADLIDAVCQLPASIAAKHAEKISQWTKSPSALRGNKIGNLVSYLAQADEITAAAILTKELLSLERGHRSKGAKEIDERHPMSSEPFSRIESWEYREFLNNHFPDFMKATPREALALVMNSLEEAVRLSGYSHAEDFRDYSEIWRPAIEDHQQNKGYGEPRDALVYAVRDSAVHCVKLEPETLENIIQALEAKRWTVFRRIALYLARLFGNENMHLVENHILNRDLFGYVPVHYEYVHLVKDYFSKISGKKQNTFLGWIKEGPKIQEGDEKPDEYKEHWQLRWLTILKGQLPNSWEKQRQRLLGKYSEPDHPDLLVWSSGVKSGPTSPVAAEQIKTMSIDDLVAFLDNWVPPSGFTMASPEGVSRSLTAAISEDPSRFATDAEKFIARDPTYVHGVFAGLHKALEAEKTFEWHPVIKLMEWVVKQGREIPGRQMSNSWDKDPDWGWTRTEVARLLEDGFNATNNQIPYKFQQAVWTILLPLTDDKDPTAEEDADSSMDPATRSINTTRGIAFHALIAYALWKKRNLIKGKVKKAREIGLGNMPEVLEVLEKHLDPVYESSPTIRAVYGWRFSNLAYLDRKWILANKERIFPINIEARRYWNAAWNACVVFNLPSVSLLQDLHAEYLFALSLLESAPNEVGWGNNPDERLVEHLMTYYAWNKLGLDSELMQVFWSRADQNLRSHGIHFIGRSEKDTPPDIISRFKNLWENRLLVAKKAEDKNPFIDELKAFGWWFISGAFEENWCMNQLEDVLQITGEVEDDHRVVERLASLADTYPLRTVRLLEKLIEGERRGWGVRLWRDDIRTLLMKILASEDNTARQSAVALINRLAARGHADFDNLLQT